jgi:hypothetical protein
MRSQSAFCTPVTVPLFTVPPGTADLPAQKDGGA